ncbi:asparaginase domain-containing protein [Alkanindiges sp. WGS2144]|uniref:asparaginase domain-containing protein n=1 Tax=Alkanindiges sp. WGS2144 TaxID=3366808 RepID=UPI003752356D
MPKPIALIYMGGTFGCTGSPLSPLPADVFLPLLGTLLRKNYPALDRLTASKAIRDSSHLHPQDWQDLIRQIEQLGQQGFERFLIIHGTDTLAYTAAFLAEYFNGHAIQLVITGSQFPLLDTAGQQLNPASDALGNLHTAYQQLSTAQACGCWVAFDGQIWPAHTVHKIHSSHTPTFAGQTTGSIQSQPDSTSNSTDITALEYLNIAIYYALPLSAEQQAAQLQQWLALKNLQALIIMAFGAGNLCQHALIAQALQQAADQQVMVILATQVPFGGVNARYAAGHWLQHYGVLSAAHLPLPAVYARLAYLMCQPLSFDERRRQWDARLTT